MERPSQTADGESRSGRWDQLSELGESSYVCLPSGSSREVESSSTTSRPMVEAIPGARFLKRLITVTPWRIGRNGNRSRRYPVN
jgi:hypothetical protein